MTLPEKADTKDAARLALQTAVAAAAMYTVMRALSLPEAFVGVLSAVLIVQPSIGRTFGSGMQRVLATLVGCGIGVLTVLFIPYGYSTAGSLALAMFAMNAVVSFKPNWRYGVVAAVAISMSDSESPLEAAGFRSLSIGIGAVIGILCSLTVWPEQASTRAEHRLLGTARLLLEALRSSTSDKREQAHVPEWRASYRREIADIDTLIGGVRLADDRYLIERRDAIDRLAQAIVVVERYARSRTPSADVSNDERETIQQIRDVAGNLLDDLTDRSSAMFAPERLHPRIDTLDARPGDTEGDANMAKIDFAIGDLREALKLVGEAVATDSGEERNALTPVSPKA